MGLKIKDIIATHPISWKELDNKILAIDSMNLLYQFLSTIRGPDGTLLTNSKGQVTSHLIGLFSRITVMMERGLKLCFVFDGKPPEIKKRTNELRKAVKVEALKQFETAKESGDLVAMRKYSLRTTTLTSEMLDSAKALIKALGLPIIQAPSEGEAQTAYMVKKGIAYASISQDYDNLIFKCPLLVRNLSLEGRRKKGLTFIKVQPEKILLAEVLTALDLTQKQLIYVAMLVGTDYNPGGIKGIGQKKAVKIVKSISSEEIPNHVNWSETFPDLTWNNLYTTIDTIPTTDNFSLKWDPFSEPDLKKLLIEEYEFSEERVNNRIQALNSSQKKLSQTGLSQFL